MLPSGPCNHFFSALPCGPGVRASLSPGPSSLHPGLTSRSPFAGRNSPAPASREPARFPHTLSIWSCVRVRPAFSDLSRFSVSAVMKQLRNPIYACTSGTYADSRQRICIFCLETSSPPPWAHAGFLRQLPDSPPTRVLDMSHENPMKPNFRTVLHGTPPPPLCPNCVSGVMQQAAACS